MKAEWPIVRFYGRMSELHFCGSGYQQLLRSLTYLIDKSIFEQHCGILNNRATILGRTAGTGGSDAHAKETNACHNVSQWLHPS